MRHGLIVTHLVAAGLGRCLDLERAARRARGWCRRSSRRAGFCYLLRSLVFERVDFEQLRRIGDVFHRQTAHGLKVSRHLVALGVCDDIGHGNDVRIGFRFNTGRDVHAFAEHVGTCVDDLAHMQTNADMKLIVLRLTLVVVADALLTIHGALNGIFRRTQSHHEGIVDGLDDRAAIAHDLITHDFVMNVEFLDHRGFVSTHLL